MADVVIYSSNYCPYCFRAKALLQERGAAFREIVVDMNPKARAEMRERAGRNTVPQIWIGGKHIGGCDDLYALDRKGGLKPLLAG
ncbi:glutaredoxin 3 [Kordiimonas marina]|uniref:glutaredoxin 3 n=1 Tax=Kordiimonas marina TaxID=2872312 RepID=UPI001FF2CEA8|nr:glutaredoxin 3 [Kordiimonas marina]